MSENGDRSQRFLGRADDYARGRPGYPAALFDRLVELADLDADSVVADLGSGTGISSAPLVERGIRVVGVEPNDDMRALAEATLGTDPRFSSRSGRAEATGLPDASVDLLLACQAFHWFDLEAVREEARRILRPTGRAALVWNARRAGGTGFAGDYENLLLEFGTDYREVGHRGVPEERLRRFFGGDFDRLRFDNAQHLDRDGLRARLLSSSYVPAAGSPRHAEMLGALDELFRRHQADGAVTIDYDVDLFFGLLAA